MCLWDIDFAADATIFLLYLDLLRQRGIPLPPLPPPILPSRLDSVLQVTAG
jgi:hypothetical protein